MKTIVVLLLTLFIAAPAWAGESNVYTDDDLNQYKSGNEYEAWREYQSIKKNSDNYLHDSQVEDALGAIQRESEDRKMKKDAAMKKIQEIEQERANDKIESMNEMKVGGFVGQARAKSRAEKRIKQEADLDKCL